MQIIGTVHAKIMFGGHGVFLEELMFGLVVDNTLYLKSDKETDKAYSAALRAAAKKQQKRDTHIPI